MDGIDAAELRLRRDLAVRACHDALSAVMTSEDSETDLVGRLAASLTPPVPRAPVQRPGEQNSGLFDIGALYAASVEQVMRRAQKARYAPPIVGIADARPPLDVRRPAARPILAQDIELLDEVIEIPGVTPRGRIGWFAVMVAWLTTASLAAVIAAGVPAHRLGALLKPVIAAPAATGGPIATATAIPTATATATATTTTTATATATATATTIATAAPIATATLSAMVSSSSPVAATAPAKVRAAPLRPRPVVRAVAAAEAPAVAPTPAPKAAQTGDVAAAPAVVAPKPAASPKEAPAAAPAGTSLEDLIRQAVANESKHH